jgi:hypothetical protein
VTAREVEIPDDVELPGCGSKGIALFALAFVVLVVPAVMITVAAMMGMVPA